MRRPLTLALALAAAAPTWAAPTPATEQEGWNLAVQVSDRLQPEEKLRVLAMKMLDAARGAERAVEGQAAGGPGWSTTQVMVKLEDGAQIAKVMAPFAEDLEGVETKPFTFGNLVLVKWERPCNVPALKRLLEKRPGVESVSLDSMIGISSSVSLAAKDGGYLLTFFQGSGDCPAGCIDKKFWKFRFDGAGKLLGQEVDEGGPRRGKPGPGLGILPAPGGGPAVMPELGLEPPEDPNQDLDFPAPARPGTRRR